MLALDIETIAQDNLIPPEFSAPANLKDPEKIKAAILEKQQKWVDEAALHAERGMLILMGWKHNTGDYVWNSTNPGTEAEVISATWELIKKQFPIVGFNIIHFDIPFLIRRSWILGVPIPREAIFDRRGYIDQDKFIDLMLLWQCGDRQETISLDTMAKAILGRGKTGHGSDFGKLWATDKQAAIEYCRADVQLTWELAKKM